MINTNTKILYVLEDKNNERINLTFTIEQIEGSVPNFYDHLKLALKDVENFDSDSCKIVERCVLFEEKSSESIEEEER